MKGKRKPVLRAEHLAEIDGHVLRRVAGATHIWTDCGCVTHGYSCDDCPIPTVPVNRCLSPVAISVPC